MKTDVHQHVWTEPLLGALAGRSELPFVRTENGLTVLYLAGERPYVIDLADETSERRAALVESDGLDRALVCLSSPLGIEALAREHALPLIDAYHEGALALGAPFGVWGAIALDRADPDDVDRLLARGCVGLSLPAGALASVDAIAGLRAVLARLETHGAPLFVHPGPGLATVPGPCAALPAQEVSLLDPSWWPAMTRYLAVQQAAWLAFRVAGRSRHPELRVIFAMLAGLAPLHAERLLARGCAVASVPDPLIYFETSSYGPAALRMMEHAVGEQQLLYGSDRPVVQPGEPGMPAALDWAAAVAATERALGPIATRRERAGASTRTHTPSAADHGGRARRTVALLTPLPR
jgi:6-methylsalicylate decarboxylase